MQAHVGQAFQPDVSWKAVRLESLTYARSSSRGGSRTHKVTRLSTSPLFRFAYPAMFKLQAPVLSRAHRPYESQLGTCPPAICE
jgi:hypothetical protein